MEIEKGNYKCQFGVGTLKWGAFFAFIGMKKNKLNSIP
jgi:hypothetical protein